jgi:hypothetical protein
VDELKSMFPNIPEQDLVHAMLKSENFEDAVNTLLDPPAG